MCMCVHKHATMCEGGHNFVDFFPPTFHGFCNQTLPVRHASPSIKFHYPLSHVATPTRKSCYCIQTCGGQRAWELVLSTIVSRNGTQAVQLAWQMCSPADPLH